MGKYCCTKMGPQETSTIMQIHNKSRKERAATSSTLLRKIMHNAYTTSEPNTQIRDTMCSLLSSERLMQYSVRMSTEKQIVSS
jgi:hypothetical protein